MTSHTSLSLERLQELLTYDPNTGDFRWKINRGNQVSAGQLAGTKSNGYVAISIDAKLYRAHRLAFMFMLGRMPLPDLDVDHIDRDRSNNAWANLREVSRAKNLRNMTAPEHKPPNVNRRGNRWQVTFSVENKTKYFGMYPTIEEAVEVAERVREKLIANLA